MEFNSKTMTVVVMVTMVEIVIVGVIGPTVCIYVYIGLGAQSKER